MTSKSDDSFQNLPYFAQGEVVKGFGRGGAELGIPTANFSNEVVQKFPEDFVCGVYYGFACVNTLNPSCIHKMVMCVGWNSHFNNTIKTVETHILHKFDKDFYGENLRIIILGYIRPMRAYKSLDELIEAMNGDIHHAKELLDIPEMFVFSRHPILTAPVIKETTISCLQLPLSLQQLSESPVKGCLTNGIESSQQNGHTMFCNGNGVDEKEGKYSSTLSTSKVIVNGKCDIIEKKESKNCVMIESSSLCNGHLSDKHKTLEILSLSNS